MILIDKLKLANNNEMYYSLANNYFQNIKGDIVNEISDKNIDIKNKSISILFDDDFFPTTGVYFNFELYLTEKDKLVGAYHLYVDQNMDFVDEFLILH